MANTETEVDDTDRERYSDLAERLAAAWISHQQGLASVDYVLKKYVRNQDDSIGGGWIVLAKHVEKVMTGSIAKSLATFQKPDN